MQKEKIRPYFLLSILVGAFILVAAVFKPFFATISLAIIFAVILHPLYIKITKLFKGFPSMSAFLSIVIAAICIVTPLTLVTLQIVNQAEGLYYSLVVGEGNEQIVFVAKKVEHLLNSVFPNGNFNYRDISEDIDIYLKKGLGWVIDRLGSVFSSIAFFSLNAFLFFISLFYLLRDGSGFKKAIISASPLSDSDDEAVFTRLENAVNSVIKGSLTIAVIQGTLVTLGFLVFGIPNSFLWGTLATVTALIPGLGTALVLGPGIIYLFLTGSQVAAFGLLIWGISAVGLIDNLIGPKLIGKNIQIHPLVILLAVLGGLAFFGPLGIFLGPLSAALFFSFLEIYMRPH